MTPPGAPVSIKSYVTEFTTAMCGYPLGVANAATQKQMHPRKKRRSSGSSGSASDKDPLPGPEDTSELPHNTSGGDEGKARGKGGRKGRQQQEKEPTAEGVLVCAWLCGYGRARLMYLLHVRLALCAFGFVRVRFHQRPSLRCRCTKSRTTASR